MKNTQPNANWLTGAMAAMAFAGALAATPASAQIYVQVAPPPPRYEAVPVMRPGQVWVPGHWEWRNNRHVWLAGYYTRARPGYVYSQPVWEQRGDRWSYRPGAWARGDRDRDGISNRNDRDRDNDGVPNRYDRNPNNPNRR